MSNFSKTYPYPCLINPATYNMYSYLYWVNSQMYDMYPSTIWDNRPICKSNSKRQTVNLKDYGPAPFVINIDDAVDQNNSFRTVLWTGDYLQVTLMNIDIGDDIGLEIHNDGDQFIRIEEGQALVKMGDDKNNLTFQKVIDDDYTIMIPAGKWHNIINIGDKPLKLYAIYAPAEHPRDTVHETKADSENS